MLLHTLLHPPLLAALAASGHGGQLLLADGNYPATTIRPPHAEVIHLNLSPGVVDIDTVLRGVLDTVPLESAVLMRSPDGAAVPAHDSYRALLGPGVEVTEAERFDFYDLVRSPSVATVVATADTRICANLLITIGVRTPST
ncbi:RbsD/FucU domain-containing protein [Microlunatus flavus]|uniref:L-fucose mutarotase n=1 Tax=Microlunatus flavus TaxID=1036181 RepID=A0A1H9B0J4_9ACTN|nr:RbsD/FucU domain-containing protein [Microlunatus flavus]SEP82550.1 L-fucose mutarotase [Microlunatus flavus]